MTAGAVPAEASSRPPPEPDRETEGDAEIPPSIVLDTPVRVRASSGSRASIPAIRPSMIDLPAGVNSFLSRGGGPFQPGIRFVIELNNDLSEGIIDLTPLISPLMMLRPALYRIDPTFPSHRIAPPRIPL